MIIDSGVITGSLQVSGSLTVTGSSNLQGDVKITGSLSVDGPIIGAITGSITNAVSASYALNASTADSATSASRATSALNADTASYVLSAVSASRAISAAIADAATTASYAIFASTALSSSYADTAISASHAIFTLQALGATSASHAISANSATNADNAANATLFNSLSSSQFPQLVLNNTYTGTQYIANTTNATTFASTPALYTDGGFRVTKDAFISGGLSIAGNLTVFGTSSVNFITSSTLVGLEFINLNTDLPALRYAGINVGDSGSAAGISSSFWYDSANNDWLFVHTPASSGQVTSSLAIFGPATYNSLGNEVGIAGNYLTKGQVIPGDTDHDHHITSSQIFDDGTTVAIAGNLQVTGSLYAGNLTGSLNGSNLVNTSVANAKLTNSTISGIALGSNLGTLTISTGLSGTSYNGSTGVTIANTGVTSAVAGTAISVSGATGAVTINNTGVTSNVAGTGVSVSGATGAVTISIGQAVGTSSNVQFNSLGVGTAGSGTTGEIRATADVTAFYSSDERLKDNITPIENPIEKLMAINGVTFDWKEGFDEIHSHKGADTGVIAQQIEAIGLPETVTTRENGFKAVKYEKLNALLIEGFKAQQREINELKALVNTLLNK